MVFSPLRRPLPTSQLHMRGKINGTLLLAPRGSLKPNLKTFQLLQPCHPWGVEGVWGGKGRERSKTSSARLNGHRTAGVRHNARNAALLSSMRDMLLWRQSTEEQPPYQNVPLHLGRLDQARFLHLPASFLPIRRRALPTGGVWFWTAAVSALPTRHFTASQPARQPVSPPGSESARKWVGLQPGARYRFKPGETSWTRPGARRGNVCYFPSDAKQLRMSGEGRIKERRGSSCS